MLTQPLAARTRRWVTAEGTVPVGEARHLIAVFGILGSVITGTVARSSPCASAQGSPVFALAELVLALTGAVLIAVYSRHNLPPGATEERTRMTREMTVEEIRPDLLSW